MASIDLGLATADTLAAAVAGTAYVNTTVNGLGDRAGIARLALVSNREVLVEGGVSRDVLKLLRDDPAEVVYHVCFGERILQVAEMALEEVPLGIKHLSSP